MRKSIIVVFLLIFQATITFSSQIVVTKYNVNLMSEPTFESSVVQPLGKGIVLEVVSSHDKWLKVAAGNGKEGYVAKNWLALSADEESDLVTLRTEKIRSIEQKLKTIPTARYRDNLDLYEELLTLDPTNERYINKREFYLGKIEEQKERIKQQSDLEILNWGWSTEYGYAKATGEVRNISGYKLSNVMAMVTWYDSSGDMITYEDSLIEFNPLMPGQRSPFRVTARHNPMMEKARLVFKSLRGKDIPSYQAD